MSPMEVYREIDIAHLRRHDARNDVVFLAWNVERVKLQTKVTQTKTRTKKKLVDLKRILIPEPGTDGKKQTATEMRSQLAVLSARYGIPLKVKKRA